MAIASPWEGLLLLWFGSPSPAPLSNPPPPHSVKPCSKTLLARQTQVPNGFYSPYNGDTHVRFFHSMVKIKSPKSNKFELSVVETSAALPRRQVWEVFSPRNRQSMLCPPSTSFTYPPIYLAHLLCWKLPLFDCLGGSCCGACKRWAIVGKGQRAGGMRGTRNPKKGNKIHGDGVGRVGEKKKGVEKHVGG